MKHVIGLSVLLALTAIPVLAQDPDPDSQRPQNTAKKTKIDESGRFSGEQTYVALEAGPDSLISGTIGYRTFSPDDWFWGGELSFTTIDRTERLEGVPVDLGDYGSLSGTFGKAFGFDRQHLVFGRLGFSVFDLTGRIDPILNEGSTNTSIVSSTEFGARLGVGYEYAFQKWISLRFGADWNVTDLSDYQAFDDFRHCRRCRDDRIPFDWFTVQGGVAVRF